MTNVLPTSNAAQQFFRCVGTEFSTNTNNAFTVAVGKGGSLIRRFVQTAVTPQYLAQCQENKVSPTATLTSSSAIAVFIRAQNPAVANALEEILAFVVRAKATLPPWLGSDGSMSHTAAFYEAVLAKVVEAERAAAIAAAAAGGQGGEGSDKEQDSDDGEADSTDYNLSFDARALVAADVLAAAATNASGAASGRGRGKITNFVITPNYKRDRGAVPLSYADLHQLQEAVRSPLVTGHQKTAATPLLTPCCRAALAYFPTADVQKATLDKPRQHLLEFFFGDAGSPYASLAPGQQRCTSATLKLPDVNLFVIDNPKIAVAVRGDVVPRLLTDDVSRAQFEGVSHWQLGRTFLARASKGDAESQYLLVAIYDEILRRMGTDSRKTGNVKGLMTAFFAESTRLCPAVDLPDHLGLQKLLHRTFFSVGIDIGRVFAFAVCDSAAALDHVAMVHDRAVAWRAGGSVPADKPRELHGYYGLTQRLATYDKAQHQTYQRIHQVLVSWLRCNSSSLTLFTEARITALASTLSPATAACPPGPWFCKSTATRSSGPRRRWHKPIGFEPANPQRVPQPCLSATTTTPAIRPMAFTPRRPRRSPERFHRPLCPLGPLCLRCPRPPTRASSSVPKIANRRRGMPVIN
jgi:hypothetical protein